jgi:RNA polymerase sigma-70 factor, ECF subfamily
LITPGTRPHRTLGIKFARSQYPGSLRLTRHSSISAEELIQACAETDDADAWEEFVCRFHRPISLSVIRTAQQWRAISYQVVDDLVQETYLKLCADKCRLLQGFAQQHPDAIPGYIKTIAANVVHDYFKSLHSLKRGAGKVPDSLESAKTITGNGSAGSLQDVEREVLLKEIAQSLEACSAGPEQERDRLIFWLYYRQGMSAQAIASIPAVGLTSKGVESAILRMTRLVRQQMVQTRPTSTSEPDAGQKGFRPAESY